MNEFPGFPATTAFFDELAADNTRAFFTAQKARFEAEWNGPMKALLAAVAARLDVDEAGDGAELSTNASVGEAGDGAELLTNASVGEAGDGAELSTNAYPDLELGAPKVFRLNRDVRFSKDKSPYKTNIGGLLPVAGVGGSATTRPAALYIQYGAAAGDGAGPSSFVAAGMYAMEPASLTRFREAVADARGEELAGLVAPLLAAGYTVGAAETLKKVPRGFPADHPRADWLRQKGFILVAPQALVGAPDRGLVERLVAIGAAVAPVVRWLAFATA